MFTKNTEIFFDEKSLSKQDLIEKIFFDLWADMAANCNATAICQSPCNNVVDKKMTWSKHVMRI